MPDPLQSLMAQLQIQADYKVLLFTFALVFLRLIVFIVQVPFLGGQVVPTPAKVAIAMAFMAMLIPPMLPGLPAQIPQDFFLMFGLFFKEFMIGLLMGYTAKLTFQAFQSAGGVIDNQRGVAQAAAFNPALGSQASLFGNMKFQMALLLFLVLNGHLHAINAFFDSFVSFPLYEMPNFYAGLTPLLESILTWTAHLFFITLQLSAPALIAIFISDTILGLANRIAPQMDVFFLSFKIKMFLGVLITFLALPYLMHMFKIHLADMVTNLRYILYHFP